MSTKEMGKNYNPHDFEDRIYADWMKEGHFKAKCKSRKRTIYNCSSATKYYRTASYGSCP